MTVCYHLSARQKKDLLIRHTPIIIMLPVPPIEIDDPADWARSVLPTDLRQYVTAAKEDEVLIEPWTTRGHRPTTLTALLGAIVPEDDRRSWVVTMVVIRVTLTPPRVVYQAGPPQWPVNVLLDGVALLGEPRDGETIG